MNTKVNKDQRRTLDMKLRASQLEQYKVAGLCNHNLE
jgi:hypothetical protein